MDEPIYHVLPLKDIKPHIDHVACKCKPCASSDGKLVMHNSWDGREFYEPDSIRLWADAERLGLLK